MYMKLIIILLIMNIVVFNLGAILVGLQIRCEV